ELERRGALTRRIRDLLNDPSEPDWIDAFQRYRQHVNVELRGVRVFPVANSRPFEFMVVLPEETFLCYDLNSLRAAEVPDGEALLSQEQRSALEDESFRIAKDSPVRIRLFVPTALIPTDLDWRRADEFLPELTIWPGTRSEPPSPSA